MPRRGDVDGSTSVEVTWDILDPTMVKSEFKLRHYQLLGHAFSLAAMIKFPKWENLKK